VYSCIITFYKQCIVKGKCRHVQSSVYVAIPLYSHNTFILLTLFGYLVWYLLYQFNVLLL